MAQLPQGCRIFSDINKASEWTYERTYLAAMVDGINEISWQISGAKKSQRPKSVLPDYVTREAKKAQHRSKAMKDQSAMNIDDIKTLLNRPRT